MTEKIEYDVLANLKTAGSFAKQFRMLAGTASQVAKTMDKIQNGLGSAGRAVMGTTARTAAGYAKVGGAVATAAGAAGIGGMIKNGLAFNEMMEDSRNTLGTVFQLYGQNQGDVVKNLQQAEGVQRRLFDIAKKSPGEFEDAAKIYQGAAASMIVAGKDMETQMKFMEKAVLLPSAVGGGLGGDVVGGQLGRIMSGGAGVEFETWVRLAPTIRTIGQELAKTNKAAKGFTDDLTLGGDLTQVWNKMAQADPTLAFNIIEKAMEPLGALSDTYEKSWEGVLGATMSNAKLVTGAFTKPLFNARKRLLTEVNDTGLFSETNLKRLEQVATMLGVMLANGAEIVFKKTTRAAEFIRDNWVTIAQTVKNAFTIGSAAIKGAFALGLTRMAAGAALIAASHTMKGVRGGLSGVGKLGEAVSKLAFMREAQRSGLDPSSRPRDSRGQFLSFQKAFEQIRQKRADAVGKRFSTGVFKHTDLGKIMQFFTKIGPLAMILGVGLPIVAGLATAFGAVFVVIGGIAAYVVSNWQAISGAIVEGLRNGTITLKPLLVAAYTFWERLKMVGQVFLGTGGHGQQFARVLDMLTGAVEMASGGISFFMRAIAYSLGIWGMLKLAFQGVLRAVLAIIEAASYLPGGPSDDTVARAQRNYEQYANGVQDTFTDIDKLLTKADEIDNFRFERLDLERISAEAEAMEKSLAAALEGGAENTKGKGPKGPKVNINHLTINQDLRDTDPDRIMSAFITPLERMADQRVQAYGLIDQGA